MKIMKPLSALGVTSILLSGLATAAHAGADPNLTSPAAFTISGNTLTIDTNAVWEDGTTYTIVGSPVQQIFACGFAKTSPSSSTGFASTFSGVVQATQCEPLWADSAGTQPFEQGDLGSTYVGSNGFVSAYSTVAYMREHLIAVSYVSAEFFADPTITQYYVGYSSSTPFTYVASAPSIDTAGAFSLNESTAAITTATAWSVSGTASMTLMVCSAAPIEDVIESGISYEDGCLIVFPTMDPSSSTLYQGESVDISTSYVGTNPMNMVQFDAAGVHSSYTSVVLWSTLTLSPSDTHYQVFSGAQTLGTSSDSASDASGDAVRATPYTGPILNTPAITSSIPAGGKVLIPGSNLSGVSAVTIGGAAAAVVVNSDGELEITIPAGLEAGTYDLVVTSDSGKLTIQDGITVSGSAAVAGNASGSTKRLVNDSAKVWVFDVAGAGKVQIFVNGEEIAWVRTDDPNDAKLKDGYLVRTVELQPGKNIIEIYVDGERVRRTAYTL